VQVHAPPTHAWPCAQSGPLPQVHVPSLHESDLAASHAKQETPFTPQLDMTGVVLHVVPWQHPAGQEAASQTHEPPTHA